MGSDTDMTARAKVVAQILTDNGHQVDPPDSGTLDDVEWERWNVCLRIVQALDDSCARPAKLGDDPEIVRIWREVGLPEYFLGNGGTNHKLVAFARRIRETADGQ